MIYTYEDINGAIVSNSIPDGATFSKTVGPSGTDASTSAGCASD